MSRNTCKPTEAWISEYMKRPPPTKTELMADLIDAAQKLSAAKAENDNLSERIAQLEDALKTYDLEVPE